MTYGVMGAFESTKIHGFGTDILDTTNHTKLWRKDLEMLRKAGVRALRYSIPWHRIEHRPGEFDFSWIDGPMRHMESTGMTPIVDPMHHTSFPDWLEDGMANPQFPELYCRFLQAFAERYQWVRDYTVINEPLPTTLFCSYTGMWYPHRRSDRDFVQMMLNVCRAICRATAMLRGLRDVNIVHIDTCEFHRALDRGAAENYANFANDRRFLIQDLIWGRVDGDHPLIPYLRGHGFDDHEMAWFQDHAQPFDMIGLDSYCHSEMEWYTKRDGRAEVRWPVRRPRGFASVARDYWDRYGVPMILAETNVRGFITDRLSWLRFMQEQYEIAVADGIDLRGFCWYPSIDCTDWSNCCTKLTRQLDPQGIWLLENRCWDRVETELSDCYAALAKGEIHWKDLPAYEFQEPLDHQLKGYIRLMSHWTDWREIAAEAAA